MILAEIDGGDTGLASSEKANPATPEPKADYRDNARLPKG